MVAPVGRELTDERERVSIGSLLPPLESVRTSDPNDEHVRVLAETEDSLPPVVVHRPTRRIIDGMHRVQAARLRGNEFVEVVFFDGNAEDAFVLAVQLNHAHGLPLTLVERKSAARRIVDSHPHWSDRKIARVVGLAASTIALLRPRSAAGAARRRTGQDGRWRPRDGAAGRRRAAELLARNPEAPVRELAKAAGISVGTASDVRARLRRGEPAVGAGRKAGRREVPAGSPTVRRNRQAVLQALRKDPSLRFTDVGRDLLRLLDGCPASVDQVARIVDSLPAHCREIVVGLARDCAVVWQHLADELAGRAAEPPSEVG